MFKFSLSHFYATPSSDLTGLQQYTGFKETGSLHLCMLFSMLMVENASFLYLLIIYDRPPVSGKPFLGIMKHSIKKILLKNQIWR